MSVVFQPPSRWCLLQQLRLRLIGNTKHQPEWWTNSSRAPGTLTLPVLAGMDATSSSWVNSHQPRPPDPGPFPTCDLQSTSHCGSRTSQACRVPSTLLSMGLQPASLSLKGGTPLFLLHEQNVLPEPPKAHLDQSPPTCFSH